jgi:hypothetical protein
VSDVDIPKTVAGVCGAGLSFLFLTTFGLDVPTEHVHDPADHPPVIGALDTTHILRQMRLNPCPLLVVSQNRFLLINSSPIRINIVLFKQKN